MIEPQPWDAGDCRCEGGMHTCGKPNDEFDYEDSGQRTRLARKLARVCWALRLERLGNYFEDVATTCRESPLLVAARTKSRHPFWLDGGYDRESVEACAYHPNHHWRVLRLGDVLEDPRDPDECMVVCVGCYVPRCGFSTDSDPCMEPRHHPGNHRYESGKIEPIGGWPS